VTLLPGVAVAAAMPALLESTGTGNGVNVAAYGEIARAAAKAALDAPETNVPKVQPLYFESFFHRCAPRLHHWIARRCSSDRTVADDLVQEVFLQAFRSWETLQYYEKPDAWIFKVAKQMIQRYQRSVSE
jgi:hypothetical protein